MSNLGVYLITCISEQKWLSVEKKAQAIDTAADSVCLLTGQPTTECLNICRNYLKWFPQCFKSSFSEFVAVQQNIYMFGCSRGTSAL